MKKIIACTLVLSMLAGCFLFGTSAETYNIEYPELLITEMGIDQYGDAANTANTNELYTGSFADRDPYEFIEIVNNSDKSVNIYDYMLAYQGARSTNEGAFEKSIQEYTPFYPGEDWTDGPYNSYNAYWSKDAKPVNPAYDDGVIAPGEVFVAWVYTLDSHVMHATFDQFRSFWNVDSSVKVFIIDGCDVKNDMNFDLKNQSTGTYSIIHSSERFNKRRSADETYYIEIDNKHHNYEGQNYETLEEVISWAVVDYSNDPIKSAITSAKEKSNFTLSFMPRTGTQKAENGYTASSFVSNKRVHLSKINDYAGASVGKLDPEQSAALATTKTTVVRTASVKPVVINEKKDRPSLIITEISCDNYLSVPQNTNKETISANGDPYECFEVYNNAAEPINIYDYMIGYQGSSAKNVSTYFERLVQEYTPIFPGADWIDAPYTAYDSLWANSTVARPVNPAYEEGVIQPGEVAVIWAYSGDSHTIHATMEQFRTFWSIPENVKSFILDANSSRDKNFNVKNSDTGTYVILKPCDKYPVRRGDDTTFNTEGGDRLGVYYDLHAGRSYETESEIVSWAVVCFNVYEPLYTFRENNQTGNARNNYTLVYAPYNGEHVYGNGFLTLSIESQKRMHLQEANTKAHIGTLTDAQKALIEQAQKAAQ